MYTLVNRGEDSSVYKYITQLLVKGSAWSGKWKLGPKDYARFNLMFGERQTRVLDYTRIGHISGLRQAVNYYRGSERLLCKKVPLVKFVRSLTGHSDVKCSWLPVSYIVLPKRLKSKSETKSGYYTDEREEFLAFAKKLEEKIWIAKSSSGSKGKDIYISHDVQAILEFIDEQSQGFVVQKYIENPLLLDGNRKFDIRSWVLLDHQYTIHVFSEGVLRTSSEPYDASDLQNITSHLTNHCIQEQFSADFGRYEDGNELFFDEFTRYLKEKHQVSFASDILPQMNTIVKKCLLGLKEELTTEGLGYDSFQLFGFDFMVDAKFHVWLLEVNGAPACANALLPALAEDLVRKAIDPIFPDHKSEEPRRSHQTQSIRTESRKGVFMII
ncbi:PREDICTED: tubulin--tyrosine ligase-like [Acropora digitifera]|uniref:tubulin--tyrosine ligase-like n=1 Tax=Acropora digitifera TaxID=70779 RepID=UPI00077ADC30|nr:PREDICTED: tubulin--tyrosine ligase-like [Acropora digitifera]